MKTLILAKYYGPTNTKGGRIKCSSGYGVTWHSFRYSETNAWASAAMEHATKHGLPTPEPVNGGSLDERPFIA